MLSRRGLGGTSVSKALRTASSVMASPVQAGVRRTVEMHFAANGGTVAGPTVLPGDGGLVLREGVRSNATPTACGNCPLRWGVARRCANGGLQ